MIGFEKYLIEQGFVKHIYNHKTNSLEITDKHVISTLGNLDHRYLHGNYKGLEIVIGLHEMGKPITLISPRPLNFSSSRKMDDDMMNIILMKQEYKELLSEIVTN